MLGEQSAKQLRGARMDEVIFAGNNHRRAMGMAEVTLTFDNADGSLAVPYAEVAVTRRAYRSGEGEYFLNKTQVRLRDIMDLLLGTGLGPDASAIISQGQIDAILSAKPESRREIFEEAAGTSKYQARKREAQRRLDQTDANAVRLNDLLVELGQQLPAMEQAVRRAKRHKRASVRLRELEIFSHVHKTAARREERASLVDVLGAEEAERAGDDAQTAALQADSSAARYEEYQATMALDERNAACAKAAHDVQELASAQAGAEVRLQESERRCVQGERDVEAATQTVADEEARVARLTAEMAAAREQRDAALQRSESAAREEEQGASKWEIAYAELRTVEDQRAAAAARAAESDAACASARSERDRQARIVAALDAALTEDREAAATRAASARALAENVAALDASIEQLRRDVVEADRSRDRAGVALEDARSSLEAARARSVEVNARLTALNEVEHQRLGVPAGVNAVVAAHESSALRGIVGVVADLIRVDARYAVAIDMALGSRVHDVVTRTAADAQAAIAMLDATKSGRATFLPLDLARQITLPLAGDASSAAGYLGRATELVECDGPVRGALEHLLRDVVVIDTLDHALTLAHAQFPATIVTLAGEVIRNASITGGRSDTESGPLSRRAQVAALSEQSAAAEESARAAASAFENARTESGVAAAAAERAAVAHVEAQLRRRDDVAARERAEIEAANFLQKIEAAAAEREAAASSLRMAEDALRRDVAAADAAREAALALEKERRAAAGRADELQRIVSGLRDAHRRAAAGAAGLVERVAQAGDDVEAARADVIAARANREERIAALAAARDEREQNKVDLAEITRRRTESDAALTALQTQADGIRADRDRLAARARDLEERLNAQSAQRQARSLELERHRIRLAEIDAEISMLASSFAQNPATQEECDEIGARYAGYDGDADADIRRLRDELARLGNVNLNALEDQAALEERSEFLRKQLADLEAARASILSVIADIDAESLRQFNATFERIAKAFGETFARLFNGGVGKISLAEADDPTQAGIDVAAQPPGKKMTSLNLLSGGERAMTAVALIFAILSVRPSPFYIFDEIDAALDEANVGRFGAALTDVARDAQTIIITHNKATMTMADRIYGITMGEPGTSNVLSLALEKIGA